ncbi:hypothetical protein JOF56_008122 [Kibdelosporangium banguiense]|uniref:3-keto-alpha-glucoside-1,2-lyase/3-keto-2-hydroxy-glucal hydratase domain-containing protein n=1 Tax=Kibdelosporangium banguiense TaxID=1365924 RepID=A0ABS4TTL3_9PSEU|nr:DUF1080 domain-containing protein [Kibdelosporangium banguiense]MBP2327737.1 hypothetical protein [Kibdelosporangium banguiense]
MRFLVCLSAVLLTACSTDNGWRQAGPGGFISENGVLTSHGGMGLYWYSAAAYDSYTLTLDWRLTGDDNSGIFLGFPPSDDPISAVDHGYEIQIDATDEPAKTTGAVYGFQSADIPARDKALHPPGEWNTFSIKVTGEHLRVTLNGTKINEFTGTDPSRSLAGHIGLQNHSSEDQVSFRNIQITPDPAPGTNAVR